MTLQLPTYTPLERLRVSRPVQRIDYIKAQCVGKIVLDLGAMDESALDAKRGTGVWLHEEIAAVAQTVVGIDASTSLPPDGLATAENAYIHRVDITELDEWLAAQQLKPDVVVAGELIEHLENPLAFLRQLKFIKKLKNAELILTTPNATALHNCLIGLMGRESTHHDHLCILSFKTLTTLMLRAGFEDWQIVPYFASFPEMRARNRGLRLRLIQSGEHAINAFEWLFPLLSFGYAVRARL